MTKTSAQKKKIHIEIVRQMLTLATAGFGLVSALAWNSLIQEFVKTYIKRWIPGDEGGILTLFMYAIIITALAVLVTYQLSKLLQRLED